jgi:hypothetical protein
MITMIVLTLQIIANHGFQLVDPKPHSVLSEEH